MPNASESELQNHQLATTSCRPFRSRAALSLRAVLYIATRLGSGRLAQSLRLIFRIDMRYRFIRLQRVSGSTLAQKDSEDDQRAQLQNGGLPVGKNSLQKHAGVNVLPLVKRCLLVLGESGIM
jgi:hypothetical protein